MASNGTGRERLLREATSQRAGPLPQRTPAAAHGGALPERPAELERHLHRLQAAGDPVGAVSACWLWPMRDIRRSNLYRRTRSRRVCANDRGFERFRLVRPQDSLGEVRAGGSIAAGSAVPRPRPASPLPRACTLSGRTEQAGRPPPHQVVDFCGRRESRMVWRLDRFGRSLRHLTEVVRELDEPSARAAQPHRADRHQRASLLHASYWRCGIDSVARALSRSPRAVVFGQFMRSRAAP